MSQLPPEQREKILEQQAKLAPIFGYFFGVIGIPLVLVIIAAIFMGIFNATLSANLDFKTSLSVAAHSYLPFFLVLVLSLVVLYARPPDSVDIQNLVASNPGVFLSNSAPQWMKYLLSSFDVFTFWIIGLLAFGYSVVRPRKIKMGGALIWVLGVWIVFVALKVGLGLLAG